MKSASTSTKTLDLGVKSAGIASFVSLARVIYVIAGGLMLIIVARVIGPGQYGTYTLAVAITGLGVSFGSVNIGPYFNKYIPKLIAEKHSHRIGILVGDGVAFLLLLSLCIMVAGDVFAYPIAQSLFGSTSFVYIVYIAMLGIVGAIIYPILTTILVGLGTGKEVAIATASAMVIQAIISITLVLLGFGFVGVLVAYVASLFLATLICLYMIHRHASIHFVASGFRNRIWHILKFSLPLAGTSIIVGLINNFVVVFMALLLISTAAIGQYGIALKISNIFDIAIGSVSAVLVPMFATALYNKYGLSKISELYHNSVYYSFVFTVPLIVYAAVLSKDIITTVFTASYNLSIIYMPPIALGTFISLLWTNASYLLISLGKVRRVLKFALIGGLVELASLIVLGILFGILGMIIAAFYIGNIVMVWLYFRELGQFKVSIKIRPILKVVLSNLIFGLILVPLLFLQIRPLYVLLVGVALGLLVYPILLVKTGAFSKDNIDVINRISKEVPIGGSVLRILLRYSELFL